MADRAKAIEQKSSRRLEYRWLYPFVMSQFLDQGLSAKVFRAASKGSFRVI
jgi:hypothetical protein